MKSGDAKSPEIAPSASSEKPYVIVCEGSHDYGLISRLLIHHGITNCDVQYPKKSEGADGESGIAITVKLLLGVRTELKGIAIVRDADVDPEDSFKKAADAYGRVKAPKMPFSIEKEEFRKGIFLMPGKGKTGAIEHLLIEAIERLDSDAMKCIQGFEDCCGQSKSWSDNKRAKLKLACFIATHCAKDPYCSPAYILSKEKGLPIKIDDPAFNELADFLKEFAT